MSDCQEEKQNPDKRVGEIFATLYPNDILPPSVVTVQDEAEKSYDFEEAIEATGYGRFNILLLLAVLPGGFASLFDTTTVSYILPSAECDLELSLFDKGVLNAITYFGAILSAFIWGFVSNMTGRRNLLKYGFLADGICNILGSMSQNFYVLVVFRFLNGFIINGPFAVNMTYLAEFHSSKHRSRAMLWGGLFPALGSIVLPMLAWGIIPQDWSISLFDGAFVYNSWRLFILVSGIPALFAVLILLCFPESPKFLMSRGQNEEALKVFRQMYAMNTGNPPESYPIKALSFETESKEAEDSASTEKVSFGEKMQSAWGEIKPLFQRPYLHKFLLIITIQLASILSINTLRLWMPQLFTLMENFDYENHDASLGAPTLCDMISITSPSNITVNDFVNDTSIIDICVPTTIPDKVYFNSMIIAVAAVIASILAGSLINLVGKKPLLMTLYATSAALTIALNWSPNSDATMAILAVYMSLTGITIGIILSFVIDVMPTFLRTMAVSLTMCVGRSGAMVGNLLFPILLSSGCMAPFIFVTAFLLGGFVLSIFVPKPPSKLV